MFNLFKGLKHVFSDTHEPPDGDPEPAIPDGTFNVAQSQGTIEEVNLQPEITKKPPTEKKKTIGFTGKSSALDVPTHTTGHHASKVPTELPPATVSTFDVPQPPKKFHPSAEAPPPPSKKARRDAAPPEPSHDTEPESDVQVVKKKPRRKVLDALTELLLATDSESGDPPTTKKSPRKASKAKAKPLPATDSESYESPPPKKPARKVSKAKAKPLPATDSESDDSPPPKKPARKASKAKAKPLPPTDSESDEPSPPKKLARKASKAKAKPLPPTDSESDEPSPPKKLARKASKAKAKPLPVTDSESEESPPTKKPTRQSSKAPAEPPPPPKKLRNTSNAPTKPPPSAGTTVREAQPSKKRSKKLTTSKATGKKGTSDGKQKTSKNPSRSKATDAIDQLIIGGNVLDIEDDHREEEELKKSNNIILQTEEEVAEALAEKRHISAYVKDIQNASTRILYGPAQMDMTRSVNAEVKRRERVRAAFDTPVQAGRSWTREEAMAMAEHDKKSGKWDAVKRWQAKTRTTRAAVKARSTTPTVRSKRSTSAVPKNRKKKLSVQPRPVEDPVVTEESDAARDETGITADDDEDMFPDFVKASDNPEPPSRDEPQATDDFSAMPSANHSTSDVRNSARISSSAMSATDNDEEEEAISKKPNLKRGSTKRVILSSSDEESASQSTRFTAINREPAAMTRKRKATSVDGSGRKKARQSSPQSVAPSVAEVPVAERDVASIQLEHEAAKAVLDDYTSAMKVYNASQRGALDPADTVEAQVDTTSVNDQIDSANADATIASTTSDVVSLQRSSYQPRESSKKKRSKRRIVYSAEDLEHIRRHEEMMAVDTGNYGSKAAVTTQTRAISDEEHTRQYKEMMAVDTGNYGSKAAVTAQIRATSELPVATVTNTTSDVVSLQRSSSQPPERSKKGSMQPTLTHTTSDVIPVKPASHVKPRLSHKPCDGHTIEDARLREEMITIDPGSDTDKDIEDHVQRGEADKPSEPSLFDDYAIYGITDERINYASLATSGATLSTSPADVHPASATSPIRSPSNGKGIAAAESNAVTSTATQSPSQRLQLKSKKHRENLPSVFRGRKPLPRTTSNALPGSTPTFGSKRKHALSGPLPPPKRVAFATPLIVDGNTDSALTQPAERGVAEKVAPLNVVRDKVSPSNAETSADASSVRTMPAESSSPATALTSDDTPETKKTYISPAAIQRHQQRDAATIRAIAEKVAAALRANAPPSAKSAANHRVRPRSTARATGSRFRATKSVQPAAQTLPSPAVQPENSAERGSSPSRDHQSSLPVEFSYSYRHASLPLSTTDDQTIPDKEQQRDIGGERPTAGTKTVRRQTSTRTSALHTAPPSTQPSPLLKAQPNASAKQPETATHSSSLETEQPSIQPAPPRNVHPKDSAEQPEPGIVPTLMTDEEVKKQEKILLTELDSMQSKRKAATEKLRALAKK